MAEEDIDSREEAELKSQWLARGLTSKNGTVLKGVFKEEGQEDRERKIFHYGPAYYWGISFLFFFFF